MKSRLLWLILATALSLPGQPAVADGGQAPVLAPQAQQPRAAHVAASVLGHFHYQNVALDDALSEKIFDQYLKALDPERLFLTEADVMRWADARTRLDDAILKEDLSLPFAMFNLYLQRMAERFGYAKGLLKQGFDFSQQESYPLRRDKASWPRSEAEVRDLWRKRVKHDWLQLRLTGKADKDIAETLDKRYENFLKRVARSKSEDAFQAFMNAYTMALDPHSSYMGPRASADFDIAMKLSLVGIGAVLEDKDDYATIKELVPGGPAALSGKLQMGDRIAGVAQGEGAEFTDVVGWRLDDTVALIRGSADSVVVLDILPAGSEGRHKRVSLVRKKISLEAQAAKKSILSFEQGGSMRRIGVISLPGFYQDFEAKQKGEADFRSATRDVTRLLQELKQDKVDAVVMDLRNNGGGSLSEAIELTGLFIDTGPVVMQRDAQGRVSVGRDTHSGSAWDGPLGVLINRSSASASEIFAAAIQDYRRGVVIGEPSFGKGTVQTLINLDEAVAGTPAQAAAPLGELKLTIAQFFRINGSTTQLRGVTPDIDLPSLSDLDRLGESAYDNALPWARIHAAQYQPVADLSEVLPLLKARHDARIAAEADFRYLQEDVAELKTLRQKTAWSLNEQERRTERATRAARLKARHEAGAGKEADRLALAEDGEEDEPGDPAAAKPAKDLLLEEAARILGDELDLLSARTDLATQARPEVSALSR